MHIPYANPRRLRYFDGVWERCVTADYPVPVIVRHGNVPGAVDLDGQSISALAAFFFCLQRIEFPVLHAIVPDFVTHMMLA